jgi:hypothetical protein
MKLIEAKTITSGQTSIVFSAIPQNFTDLVLKLSARTVGGVYPQANCLVSINDSSSPYYRYLLGGGSGSGGSGQSSLAAMIWSVNANVTTANTFGNGELYIPNYTSTTTKSASADGVLENNATDSGLAITANKWESSTAINTITLTTDSGNFAAGTTVSLYGIGGAGDGWAPKATGGIISKSGDYYVHTFTASGTFTPTAALANVEYLVIAGGGGGGNNGGCGGGAGGYRSSVTGESSGGGASAESKLSLVSGTAYTVTVGAGGAYAAIPQGSRMAGGTGGISTFATITSAGGGGGSASGDSAGDYSGKNGGSGGGGAGYNTSSGVGGTGTTGQGFNGGNGTDAPSTFHNGGGGGAGGAGALRPSPGVGGVGGAGVSSSIRGSATTRASGGSSYIQSTATPGGGGASSVSGTANTGGGGGGDGGAGGSGIVIVRYLA